MSQCRSRIRCAKNGVAHHERPGAGFDQRPCVGFTDAAVHFDQTVGIAILDQARASRTFSSARGRKDCPEKPGFTLITSTVSQSS